MGTSNPVPGRNNKRIASNTFILFARMFAIMVINLYAVRVVLKGLGEEDYGIFNAIAGVVLTSTFITSTLATAIQRFYSFSLGKNDEVALRKIFSASVNISLFLAIVITIILESVGLWFIHTQMTIPTDRLFAAECIFHFALATFILSLLQIPFTAAIFSYEDMNIFAFISMGECLGRLAVAILIGYITFDHLIAYSCGLLIVAICVCVLYALIALHRYTECRYQQVKDKKVYKELLSFSSYSMYGTLAGVGMIQGNTILLNVFFGPLTNAAYSIANQLYNAINAMNNSVILAFRPVMIKSYAANEQDYLNKLFYISNKFLFYAMLCVAVPAIFEMPTILNWWLGDRISIEMILFSRLFIVYCVIIAMHNPITIIIQATGKIKYYYLCVETITIMCLPVSWALFKMGVPAYGAFLAMIVTCLVSHVVRVVCLKHNYNSFSYKEYLLSFILQACAIATAAIAVTYFVSHGIESMLLKLMATIIVSTITIFLLTYFIGLTQSERKEVCSIVKQISKR